MIELTDSTFEETMHAAQGTVVLDFYAEWCPPCKKIAPILDELENELEGYEFYRIDVDQNRDLVDRFGIQAMPTLIRVDNDANVNTMVGAASKDKIKAFVVGS